MSRQRCWPYWNKRRLIPCPGSHDRNCAHPCPADTSINPPPRARQARRQQSPGLCPVSAPVSVRYPCLPDCAESRRLDRLRKTAGTGPDLIFDPPNYITPHDIAVLLQLWIFRQDRQAADRIELASLLELIIAAGRGWVHTPTMAKRLPARAGPLRTSLLAWEELAGEAGALIAPALHIEGGAEGMVMGHSACCLDPDTGKVGSLELPVAAEEVHTFLGRRRCRPANASWSHMPCGRSTRICRHRPHLRPKRQRRPCRFCSFTAAVFCPAKWAHMPSPALCDLATLAWRYGDHLLADGDLSLFTTDTDGQSCLLPRNIRHEADYRQQLQSAGLPSLRLPSADPGRNPAGQEPQEPRRHRPAHAPQPPPPMPERHPAGEPSG